jgi:pimeloyl-ACP methyl ester carboxylesterase
VRLLGCAGIAVVSPLSADKLLAQGHIRFEKHGAGPAVLLGPPVRTTHIDPLDPKGVVAGIRTGYLSRLVDRYTVVLMDFPPVTDEALKEVVDSFSADRACADILDVADRAGIDRFAWCGYSFGGGVGLQLAARTKRLTALVCGSWSPLGWPYQVMPDVYAGAPRDLGKSMFTYFKSIEKWPERESIAQIACPRLVLVGENDEVTQNGFTVKIAEVVREHRSDLERLGWSVQFVSGMGHNLGSTSDVSAPLVRAFLDRALQ